MIYVIVLGLGVIIVAIFVVLYVRNGPNHRTGTREQKVDDLAFGKLEKRFQKEQRRRDETPPTHEAP